MILSLQHRLPPKNKLHASTKKHKASHLHKKTQGLTLPQKKLLTFPQKKNRPHAPIQKKGLTPLQIKYKTSRSHKKKGHTLPQKKKHLTLPQKKYLTTGLTMIKLEYEFCACTPKTSNQCSLYILDTVICWPFFEGMNATILFKFYDYQDPTL